MPFSVTPVHVHSTTSPQDMSLVIALRPGPGIWRRVAYTSVRDGGTAGNQSAPSLPALRTTAHHLRIYRLSGGCDILNICRMTRLLLFRLYPKVTQPRRRSTMEAAAASQMLRATDPTVDYFDILLAHSTGAITVRTRRGRTGSPLSLRCHPRGSSRVFDYCKTVTTLRARRAMISTLTSLGDSISTRCLSTPDHNHRSFLV
jgi:hypothetical protein